MGRSGLRARRDSRGPPGSGSPLRASPLAPRLRSPGSPHSLLCSCGLRAPTGGGAGVAAEQRRGGVAAPAGPGHEQGGGRPGSSACVGAAARSSLRSPRHLHAAPRHPRCASVPSVPSVPSVSALPRPPSHRPPRSVLSSGGPFLPPPCLSLSSLGDRHAMILGRSRPGCLSLLCLCVPLSLSPPPPSPVPPRHTLSPPAPVLRPRG